MLATMARLFGDRKAATAVEYGLILSLIVLACVAAITSLADTTSGMWNRVQTKVADSSR